MSNTTAGPAILPTMKRLVGPALAFAATIFLSITSGALRGDFRIDEAHKLAETRFLSLLSSLDSQHPDWFRDPVERANPPLGKYAFGFAIRTVGLPLPSSLQVAQLTNHGQRYPPSAVLPLYRSYLPPARLVSLLATAATAALVYASSVAAAGELAGLTGTILFILAFLPQTFAGTAVFDPLLMLLAALSGMLLPLMVDSTPRSGYSPAILAGALAGLATAVRVTGAVGLLAIAGALLLNVARGGRLRSAVAQGILAVTLCLVISTAINPYYWGAPHDPAVSAVYRAPQFLPSRIVTRYRLQFADLETLLDREITEQGGLDGSRKRLFVFNHLFGDWVGLLTLLGLTLALAMPCLERGITPAAAELLAGATLVTGVTLFWLPLGYPRYLLIVTPWLATAAAFGLVRLVEAFRTLWRERRIPG